MNIINEIKIENVHERRISTGGIAAYIVYNTHNSIPEFDCKFDAYSMKPYEAEVHMNCESAIFILFRRK